MALRANHPLAAWLLGLAGLIVVAASALPYAGSWNDGSRLAAVESIADRHTMAIDDSIFCRVPPDTLARGCPPYHPDDINSLTFGTRDKLLINGHFYSDKPAVISLLMAGFYQTLRWLGLPTAAERPDFFCWTLTLATAGAAYVVTLLSLHRLGQLIGLPEVTHLTWVASFALCTFALTYTRHVNNHIPLLAVLAVMCLQFVHLRNEAEKGSPSRLRLAALGTLAGIGFNLDLGSGPLLVACALGLVLYRCRRVSLVGLFLLSAAPWMIAGLGLNYAIGGVWKPMNMVPEYSDWPGSPFTSENLTGFARRNPFGMSVYALSLLFGKHGFIVHNLPLLLLFPAMVAVLRRPSRDRPELIFSFWWCCWTWLTYSVLSSNSGGACCSIRWFVPFLAPAYYVLALYLREYPRFRADFLILSAWGGLLAAIMWRNGPFIVHMVPMLWPIVGAALLCWLAHRIRSRRSAPLSNAPAELPRPSVAA
jgi:hypothetical protein